MTSPTLFEHRLKKWVQAQGIVTSGDRIVLAVSGGADSIALFSLFLAWQRPLDLSLFVAHMNHGLRGIESEEDAEWVGKVCQRFDVPFFQKRIDLVEIFKSRKRSSKQALAREIRYQALTQVAKDVRADKIALGHTLDDQAETVIMCMLRGAGAHGLAGMSPIREPQLIRPLLRVNRQEISQYLAAKNWEYRTDSSNDKPIYLRNRLRAEAMPILKAFNPNLTQVLSRQADILREETNYLDSLAHAALDSVSKSCGEDGIILDRISFLALPLALQRRVIGRVFQTVGKRYTQPHYETVEEVLRRVVGGGSGASVDREHLRIFRDYDKLHFERKNSELENEQTWPDIHLPFVVPSTVMWPPTGEVIDGMMEPISQGILPSDSQWTCFDATLFSHDLQVRTWRPGDYFFPSGFGGKRKKLQDFFSDIKVSRSRRKKVPILVSPEGILCVGKYRSDHRFRVTESTKRILKIQIIHPGQQS